MSDPYFHYKGSVTLENDTHRYVVQGFELWEEREVITVQFEERPWTEYHVPGVSSWHGVATLSGAMARRGHAERGAAGPAQRGIRRGRHRAGDLV